MLLESIPQLCEQTQASHPLSSATCPKIMDPVDLHCPSNETMMYWRRKVCVSASLRVLSSAFILFSLTNAYHASPAKPRGEWSRLCKDMGVSMCAIFLKRIPRTTFHGSLPSATRVHCLTAHLDGCASRSMLGRSLPSHTLNMPLPVFTTNKSSIGSTPHCLHQSQMNELFSQRETNHSWSAQKNVAHEKDQNFNNFKVTHLTNFSCKILKNDSLSCVNARHFL